MSKIREAYTFLSSTSTRSEVSAVLQSIIEAGPFTFDDANRQELVQLLLDDITSTVKSSNKSRLNVKDVAQALLAVKTLGKNPAGSEVIATSANLSALLSLSQSLSKDNLDASNEALRCIANALLLIDQARSSILTKEVGGGEAIIELLEKSSSPERIFLASRILFLSTASVAHAGQFIKNIVENKPIGHHSNIVEIISNKLENLLAGLLGSEKMAREALIDILKFVFNLLLHYPRVSEPIVNESGQDPGDDRKVIGDCWNDRLDGMLLPLLHLFNTLPPTFPSPLASPMTHVIHALITIPVTPSLRSKWLPSLSNPGSPKASKTPSPGSLSPPNSSEGEGLGNDKGKEKEHKANALDRAFSRLSGRKLSLRSSSHSSITTNDTLLRAYDLLDVTLSHYLPGTIDPDDISVRDLAQRETDCTLDDLACPLVLLITKLCAADEGSRKRMRDWIVPDDLDRTNPLEGRSDILGRSLRLLAAVYHPRMKEAIGEMLYAICDSNASTLASYVGYGNVAGFLYNKGIMSAPPKEGGPGAPSTTADGVPINPITGVAQETTEAQVDMTDEEKEREAEKLFVLFDRLERSGALPPNQNPIRKGIQEGKLSF